MTCTWREAVEHELATMHATADSYATPLDAVRAVIDWNVMVSLDPRVNGGKRLVDSTPCTWREDEDGSWDTDCGDCFVLISDGPSDNRMKFCCYCGQPITEIGFDEEGEEPE